MARFANPMFAGASDALRQIAETRLRGPIMEGQLRQLVAGARRNNALAALDEQTFGRNNAITDLLGNAASAGAGVNPNEVLLNLAGNVIGSGNKAAIGNIGEILSSILSVPTLAGNVTPMERDVLQVGSGTVNAPNTFSGLEMVLAERAAGRRGRGGGGGGGGRVASNKGLTSGGRTFLSRSIRDSLKFEGAEEFEGAAGIAADAALLADRLMREQGMSENEAVSTVLDQLKIDQPMEGPGFLGRLFGAEGESAPGAVSLGDILGGQSPVAAATDTAMLPTTPGAPAPPQAPPLPVPAPTAPAPTQSAGIGQDRESQLISEARDAIARGKNPAAVAQRMRELGLDPTVIGLGS